MTPDEHARQKARVLASEMLSPIRAQRHGVYANRKPLPLAPAIVTPGHQFMIPVVTERLL